MWWGMIDSSGYGDMDHFTRSSGSFSGLPSSPVSCGAYDPVLGDVLATPNN
jgi:hypothetical protein